MIGQILMIMLYPLNLVQVQGTAHDEQHKVSLLSRGRQRDQCSTRTSGETWATEPSHRDQPLVGLNAVDGPEIWVEHQIHNVPKEPVECDAALIY